MKTKTQKRLEATQRSEERAKRTAIEQVQKLNREGHFAAKERMKLEDEVFSQPMSGPEADRMVEIFWPAWVCSEMTRRELNNVLAQLRNA